MKELGLPLFLAVTYSILVALPDGFSKVKRVPIAVIRPTPLKLSTMMKNQKMKNPTMKALPYQTMKNSLPFDGFVLDQDIGARSLA